MDDCVSEIRAFLRGGEYAHEVLLPKVINNIWKHYKITAQEDKTLSLENAYRLEDMQYLRGVETKISCER
jgi:hypothetical protein